MQRCHSRVPNHTFLMAMLQMEVRPFRDSNYDLRRVEQDMAVQAVVVVQDTGVQATGGQVRGGKPAWWLMRHMNGQCRQHCQSRLHTHLYAASSGPSCNGSQSGGCLAACHKQTLLPHVVACSLGSLRAGITLPPTPFIARLQPRHNAAQYQARQCSEQVKQQLLDAPGMADFLQSACSR